MYNPRQIENELTQIQHGAARVAAIRQAIRQADENHDLPYQLSFRLDLCYESDFYGDSLDLLLIFPEILALVDAHPNIPITPGWSGFADGLDRVLWYYKWLIANCSCFYQISLQDCERFFEDFSKRSLAYGYNLKPMYREKYALYDRIDKEYAKECFQKFRELPKDGNGNCEACDRNVEIEYYLKQDDMEKANELAEDIESFRLICGKSEEARAWLRMKAHYLHYYLKKRDYEKALDCYRQMERKLSRTQMREFCYWEELLCCYSHIDIGRALKIYKERWKEWENERCPEDKFNIYIYIIIFFRELGKQRKGNTIKLDLDRSFPLYSADRTYKIAAMEEYYYKNAKDIAQKFDKRNGTDSFMRELEESISGW